MYMPIARGLSTVLIVSVPVVVVDIESPAQNDASGPRHSRRVAHTCGTGSDTPLALSPAAPWRLSWARASTARRRISLPALLGAGVKEQRRAIARCKSNNLCSVRRGFVAYPKIKRWGSLSRAGGFLQARGRCAWTSLTPIEMRMETTTVLAHFNRHEERLRWRLCSPPKTSRSWSSLEERSMTEVRVGS